VLAAAAAAAAADVDAADADAAVHLLEKSLLTSPR